MSPPHILIAGAGIGGLTVALALARRGVAVTVAEKRTAFAEAGAGIQISPNAGRVLDGLDLALPLKRVAVSSQRLSVRRWSDDAELTTMPMSGEDGLFRLLHRAELHEILLDAARAMPNLRLLVGRAVEAVRTVPGGVEIALAGASGQAETLPALALIGADGIWSRVRQLAGGAEAPRFTGYEAWRTLLPATQDAAREVRLHLGGERHAVSYPVAAGRLVNLVIVRRAGQARPDWSRQGEARELGPTLAGATPALRRLAGSAPDWRVWSLHRLKPAPMASGRIALLGDAAHPVLPFLAQGAALAIEDAAVLARCLCAHLEASGAEGVPAALAEYAKARAARVAGVERTSRDNARAYHLGWPLSLARDLALRRLGPDGMRARHDWVYRWRDGSA